MSHKRPRDTFEADSHAPYAIFGTPLPDEADGRDDGSYLPLWKQDVRDERGRKRLHGAFTGGWSAGYFNTVGSKEGWTPSTFVSSRGNRRKDGGPDVQQHRPEDYMDEEDLADAAEAQKLQTSDAFAGLGSSMREELGGGGLVGLLRAQGDTMGLELLRKMGWKDGQGIGPKLRRGARLDAAKVGKGVDGDTYLFAPDNAAMITFVRKTDRKGLGHSGEGKPASLGRANDAADVDDDDEPFTTEPNRASLLSSSKEKSKAEQRGIGVGILNDTGSDEEDPYEIGPRIRYNRVIGADKKKKKGKKQTPVNPALANAPIFVPKTVRAGSSLRRCHDGRLPLTGFVLARIVEDMSALLSQYAPPPVPPGWKSARNPDAEASKTSYVSTADAAKASSHDPRSRAAALGEQALPGKSVFDFISAATRDKLASASGRKDLPPARGEIPEGYALSEEEQQKMLWDRVPKLDRDTALAAILRSASGPYADSEAKRARYRSYLEYQESPGRPPPAKLKGTTDDEFLQEMNEFYNCARIFKPMTGFMASRFTTAKTTTPSTTPGDVGGAAAELISQPEPKVADPAEEAARMGMFGNLTRTVEDFFPTRLLCKRFNVKAPAHSQPDREPAGGRRGAEAEATEATATGTGPATGAGSAPGGALTLLLPPVPAPAPAAEPEAEVNPERNDAVEGSAAHAEVLRAIFGDSDSE